MTSIERVILRADEEIAEHGSIDAAIMAIKAQIASHDYPRPFTIFMRRVIARLTQRQSRA